VDEDLIVLCYSYDKCQQRNLESPQGFSTQLASGMTAQVRGATHGCNSRLQFTVARSLSDGQSPPLSATATSALTLTAVATVTTATTTRLVFTPITRIRSCGTSVDDLQSLRNSHPPRVLFAQGTFSSDRLDSGWKQSGH